MNISVTLILVLVTCGVSIPAFGNSRLMNDLIFYPPAISQHRQYYQFLTHGFIHADIPHLAFNMIALYSFGEAVEKLFAFECFFGPAGRAYYLLMYLSAIVVASVPTYLRNRNNYQYRSLGASGAVSAVVFAGLVMVPQLPVNIMFIPIDIPGYVFGIAFLVISGLLARRGSGTINHSAHFWGAAYGIAVTLILCLAFAKLDVFENFIRQVQSSGKILPFDCY